MLVLGRMSGVKGLSDGSRVVGAAGEKGAKSSSWAKSAMCCLGLLELGDVSGVEGLSYCGRVVGALGKKGPKLPGWRGGGGLRWGGEFLSLKTDKINQLMAGHITY